MARGYCSMHYRQKHIKKDFSDLDKFNHDGKCSINDCNKKYLAKGYCQMHYTRFLNHSENIETNRLKTPQQRFYSQIEKNNENGCWEWTGFILNHPYYGYGSIRVEKKIVRAHRFSYELHKGKIPNGLHVCHSCDNRRCVNPDHLWIGTHQDNMRDMMAKGRHNFNKKTNKG